MSIYRKYSRKPKEANLAGLMVISSDEAFDVKNNRFKKGVYGIVDKDLPFVSKTVVQRDGNKRRKFVQDVTELPDIAKERIMAFFDVPENKKREKCYLVERKLFDEVRNKNNSTSEFYSNSKMIGETTQKTTKQGSSKGKNSGRKPGTTSYKTSTSKKATSRDNNSLW